MEARAVGIHVPFAPVLDVNNNPDNPIINVRSFGEDPVEVSKMGISFIRGIQENGGIATDLFYHKLGPLLLAIAGPNGEYPSRVVGSGTIGHRPRQKGRERKR